ncbi:MAG: peptidylprolyl isomerase [Bacteroidota bacterium]
MIRILIGLMLGSLLTFQGLKGQTLDGVVAIVGEEIILQSDVDNQVNYLKINGERDNGTLPCRVLESLIVSKLLLDKARQDSLEVSEIQVETELDNRMSTVLQQIDEAEFERIYGKSVPQFRADIRSDVRKELLIQQQQQSIFSGADITPKEVKRFFRSLNRDSVGLLPAEVEVNQIVIKPPFSEESRQAVMDELKGYQVQAQNGTDFALLASNHTEEPGGKNRRGDLGWFGRGQMVPPFEEVAYNLREGEVSAPVETEFGIHIIKLYERRGEMLHAAHILKRLSYSPGADQVAIDSLKTLIELVETDSLTFEQAAIRYSQDRLTSFSGGAISNPQTGELRIPLDALDADLYFKIDEMEEGEISEPMEMFQPDGSRAFHVIYLKKKIPPHKPNLEDDYQKIYNAALQAKQAEIFDNWLESAKKNIYIDIKPTECANALQGWLQQ